MNPSRFHFLLLLLAGLSTTTVSLCAADLPDLTYAVTGERSLELDLHLPEGDRSDVLLLHVHGGAWRSGSRKNVPIMALVERGFAIASVEYRLSGKAPFPANVQDIKAAIRFLRANQARLNLNAERIVMVGESAGGHLAALVGVTNGHEQLEGAVGDHPDQSSEVQGIVSFFGASNLETILAQSTPHGLSVRVPALKLLLGGTPEEKPELARLASPVAHVDSGDPPLLLIHGDQDPQMPVNQSLELQSVYESHGLPVTFLNVHGGAHGGSKFFDQAMLDRVEAFLKNLPLP